MNLLAANINWPSLHCSGSGIYAGRLGALKTFVSQTPTTKVLIAKVPTILPYDISPASNLPRFHLIENATSTENKPKYETFVSETNSNATGIVDKTKFYDEKLGQEDMNAFEVQFLDLSRLSIHNGTVCNGTVCCHFDIEVTDQGQRDGMVRFWFYRKIINKELIKLKTPRYFQGFEHFDLYFVLHIHSS